MGAERARLANRHGLGTDVLADKSMDRSYKAMAILKDVLADARVATTADLVKAFTDRMGELKNPV